MNQIYNDIYNSYSKKDQSKIDTFIKEHKKLSKMKKDNSFNLIDYADFLINKYEVASLSSKDYLNKSWEILNIKNERLKSTLIFYSNGIVCFLLQDKYKDNHISEIVITRNIDDEYDFCINIKKNGNLKLELYFKLSEKNSIKYMHIYNRDAESFNSIFPTDDRIDTEPKDLKKYSEIFMDMCDNFNEPQKLSDLFLLKYDTNILEDEILSIIYKKAEKTIDLMKKSKVKI